MFDASTGPVTDFDTGENVNVIDTAGTADITGVKVSGLEYTKHLVENAKMIFLLQSVRFFSAKGYCINRVYMNCITDTCNYPTEL